MVIHSLSKSKYNSILLYGDLKGTIIKGDTKVWNFCANGRVEAYYNGIFYYGTFNVASVKEFSYNLLKSTVGDYFANLVNENFYSTFIHDGNYGYNFNSGERYVEIAEDNLTNNFKVNGYTEAFIGGRGVGEDAFYAYGYYLSYSKGQCDVFAITEFTNNDKTLPKKIITKRSAKYNNSNAGYFTFNIAFCFRPVLSLKERDTTPWD